MRRLLLLIFSLLVIQQGRSEAAATCLPASGFGRPMTLSVPLDEPTRLGLGYSMNMSLHLRPGGAVGPGALMDGPACTAGQVSGPGGAWTVRKPLGRDIVLAWLRAPIGDDVVFLTLSPSLSDAYAFSQTDSHGKTLRTNAQIAMLVLARQSRLYLLKLYDAPPTDDVLLEDLKSLINGKPVPIAEFDPRGRAVTFHMPTRSHLDALLLPPLPGEGGAGAVLTEPDGQYFQAVPKLGVRMAGSGFICPPRLATATLVSLWVADVSATRRDLGCSYATPGRRLSITVTRRPERPATQTVLDLSVRTLGGPAPPNPVAGWQGDPTQATVTQAWTTSQDQQEAVWVEHTGDWYIEVVDAFPPAEQASANDLAMNLLADARDEIGRDPRP